MKHKRMEKFKTTIMKAWKTVLIMALATPATEAFSQESATDIQPITTVAEIEDGDYVVIPPLFEYVETPDDLPDLQSRTDYLMENFWTPFDFKNTAAVDQNALNHAFEVYTGAMEFASEKKIKESVKNLINKIKGNPVLTFQFTKAAEEWLYGPRAEIWYDEIYMDFLQNLVDNKKISDNKKKKYAEQLSLLKANSPGAKLPSFALQNTDGIHQNFPAGKDYILIEFVTPQSEGLRYSNLKLDISGTINDMIEDGELLVMVVNVGEGELGINENGKWELYKSGDAAKTIDFRRDPSFYIISKDKTIKGKNLEVDDAIRYLEYMKSNSK